MTASARPDRAPCCFGNRTIAEGDAHHHTLHGGVFSDPAFQESHHRNYQFIFCHSLSDKANRDRWGCRAHP